MTSRERVIRAMEFKRPDRLPVRYNVNVGSWTRHGRDLERVLRRYFVDASAPECPPPGLTWAVEDDLAWIMPRSFVFGAAGVGRSQDEWGCIWRKLDPGLLAGYAEFHPLGDWDAVASYRWPDPLSYWRFDTPQIEAMVKWARERGKFLLVGDLMPFEHARALRGTEALFMDIAAEPERVVPLMDKLVDYAIGTVEAFARYEPDGFRFVDDWGTQSQLMIRPELWRELFKPRYREVIEAIHGLGAKVYWHSDGYTMDVIPDLIELGVDLLHVQAALMDYSRLAELTRGRVCLLAEPDRQWLLPRGTGEQVEEEVRKIVETFASLEGGLIAHGSIEPDVPLSNVEAMYRAFERCGREIYS